MGTRAPGHQCTTTLTPGRWLPRTSTLFRTAARESFDPIPISPSNPPPSVLPTADCPYKTHPRSRTRLDFLGRTLATPLAQAAQQTHGTDKSQTNPAGLLHEATRGAPQVLDHPVGSRELKFTSLRLWCSTATLARPRSHANRFADCCFCALRSLRYPNPPASNKAQPFSFGPCTAKLVLVPRPPPGRPSHTTRAKHTPPHSQPFGASRRLQINPRSCRSPSAWSRIPPARPYCVAKDTPTVPLLSPHNVPFIDSHPWSLASHTEAHTRRVSTCLPVIHPSSAPTSQRGKPPPLPPAPRSTSSANNDPRLYLWSAAPPSTRSQVCLRPIPASSATRTLRRNP